MAGQSEKEVKAGERVRSYSGLGVSLVIPEIIYTDDFIRIKFSIRNQHGNASAMIVDRCTIIDKVGKCYQSVPDDIFLTPGFTQKQIITDIENKGKGPMWRDASVCVVLCSQNGRKFEIHYKSDVGRKLVLEYIVWNPMVSDDEQRFIDVFNAFMQPKPSDKSNDTSDMDQSEKAPLFTTPTLEEYKRAILREMTFLKQNGGRKYKVTNGRYVSRVGAMYSYHFEMEAELNLSDDAPITVTTGGTTADGTVLVCEDFQIIIVIDKDLGSRVGSAYISVEPWKLLEVLHKKLVNLTSLDRIAIKLLEEGPSLARKESYTEIPQGQEAAKIKAKREDITVIWGPPGTGKTYTMSEIAMDFLAQGKSILVVSHSNISVDGVVKQLEKLLMERGKEQLLTEGKILRYGYVREEELAKNPYAVAFNYTLGKNRVLKQQMDHLFEERDKLKANHLAYNERRVQIERELKGIRAKVREMERIYVERAQFVATTISKVNIDQLFDDKKYDVVMFDEVSMAYVPQLLSAAAYAREHFIAVGDFRQLSPIAQSEAKKVLDTDIFSYLHISTGDNNIYSHPWLVMLNEQRRMHPNISAFPNRYVYNKLLKDHESVKINRNEFFNREPLCGSPMNLIDLSGTYCAASKNSDNSRFNILSAVISFATAITAEDDAENSIGIITPYAAQTRLIRAMIQDYRKTKQSNIACSTVHQFQGSERNLIVFDAVESFPSTKPGWLMSKNDNGAVTRLINVAVTRAKGKFVTVANSRFWLRKFDGTHHIFYRLVKYLMEKENVVELRDGVLREYINRLDFGKNIRCYSNFEECQATLKKDLAKARDKISVSIPDGKLESKSERELLGLLQEQKINGIRILMKSSEYAVLPEEWKKYTWGSDEAMFPLLAIDDTVIWYGVPDSRLMFKDGDMGYSTVCKTILRITGEHTIEILKSLSDLEYRIVDGQRKPLHEKDARDIKADDEDGKGAAGLEKFVEEYAKCPKCKQPMKLTRSRAGKIFLKCSVCGELDYLKPDFTNWYISKNHIRCPIHKCGLCAGVGKYGIFVKCDQGHYLKPDEI